MSGSVPSVNGTLNGAPFKCIACVAGGTSLLVLERSGFRVTSLAAFKGKTIATLRFPSDTNTTPKYVLTKLLGIDPAASGITVLELPPGTQTQAVTDGRADFAVVYGWDASIGVTHFGLDVVYGLADVIGPHCSSAIFATQAYLATNGDVAQHLLNAIAEATKVIHTEPGAYEAANARRSRACAPPPSTFANRLLAMKDVVPRNPIITREAWDKVMGLELGTTLKETRHRR